MIKKLKLLDIYIAKQVFLAFLVCVVLFMIVWIAPETLLRTIQRTLSGQYTIKLALAILTFELPKILGYALPIGIFLGALFTFDKLSKDFEITVLRSFGISFSRIILPVIVISIIVAIATFVVNDLFIPYSTVKMNKIKHENESSHFVFPLKDENDKMQKIIIVSNFDNNLIEDVVTLDFYSEDGGASLIRTIYVSDNANYSKGEWILPEAKKYIISQEGVFENVSVDRNIKILDGKSADNAYTLMKYSIKQDRELTNNQLINYVKLLKVEKMTDEYNFMFNKYLQRFSHSIMCVLFAILGCILGFSQPREQRLIGFTIAVGAIFLYYITMPFLDLMAEKSILSPYLTSTCSMLFTAIFIFLLKRKKDL